MCSGFSRYGTGPGGKRSKWRCVLVNQCSVLALHSDEKQSLGLEETSHVLWMIAAGSGGGLCAISSGGDLLARLCWSGISEVTLGLGRLKTFGV